MRDTLSALAIGLLGLSNLLFTKPSRVFKLVSINQILDLSPSPLPSLIQENELLLRTFKFFRDLTREKKKAPFENPFCYNATSKITFD